MKKKITSIIEANAKDSETINRIEGFATRFNIEKPFGNLKHFQNRCINAIEAYIGEEPCYVNDVSSTVFDMLGLRYTYTYTGFLNSALYKVLTHEKYSPADDQSLIHWLMIVECMLNIDLKYEKGRNLFAMQIAEALKISGINAVLCNTPDGYLFYPANAELLDQKVVIDVLNWLSDYPLAKEQFNQALRMFLQGDRTRHIIDSLRLSFELFLKQYLNNNTSIENQQKVMGQYLKDHNVSVEIRNMFTKLVDYFAVYNNEHVKHNDDSDLIAESEIEFLIYLSGSFMRFMIQLKIENSKEVL